MATAACADRGLAYLNNRYHDPQLGTFISVDPLVTITGEPYIYGSGNPTTLSDPMGLRPFRDPIVGVDLPRPVSNPHVEDDAPVVATETVDSIVDDLNGLSGEDVKDGTSIGSCVGVGVSLFVISWTGQSCSYQFDGDATTYTSLEIGMGVGLTLPNLSGTTGIVYSNADSADQIEGWSVCVSGSFAYVQGTACGAINEVTWKPTGVWTVFGGVQYSLLPVPDLRVSVVYVGIVGSSQPYAREITAEEILEHQNNGRHDSGSPGGFYDAGTPHN